MRYLFAATALAFSAPAAADHHDKGQHDKGQHAGHDQMAEHGAHHQHDAAMFMKHHGEALSAAINHPTRAEDRARDQHRHPAETLAFFHVMPNMKVGEYAPGGGWYTRLLGHYLGGEGKLVGLFFDPTSGAFDEKAQQGIRDGAAKFAGEAAGFTGLPADHFSGFTLDAIPEGEAESFDRVLVIRMMHNLMRWNIADSELKKIRTLLKPGGMLGIVQHRAPEGASSEYANGSKGYVRQEDVVGLVESLGFEFVGSSEVNANAKDPANHERGVWEMPPVWATKKEELKNLGESDRMTLLFRKRP